MKPPILIALSMASMDLFSARQAASHAQAEIRVGRWWWAAAWLWLRAVQGFHQIRVDRLRRRCAAAFDELSANHRPGRMQASRDALNRTGEN